MLVSHRKKFIYTKTVKTAGTSVESYFEPLCMKEGEWVFSHHRSQHVSAQGLIGARGPGARQDEWFNHMPAADIRRKLGEGDWNRYFKFCVIRNPFDKLVSLFFFQQEKGLLKGHDSGDIVRDFRNWIARGVLIPDRKQYVIDGEVCMDFLIRYEDLDNGIRRVCEKLQVPFEPERVPRLKSGIRDRSFSLAELYSEDSIRAVETAYAFEIQEFGYAFPS